VPRLAIVIPAVGSAEALEATLLTVLENRPDDCEVVAVTNFDYADPYDLGDEVRFVAAGAQADVVGCAAAAIHVVRSPVVHVLTGGCEATEGWADRALAHFADLSVGAVAPVVLRSDRRDQILSAGIEYHAGGGRRLRVVKLRRINAAAPEAVFGAGLVGGFFRRSALEAVGGWSIEKGPELAEVELAWAMCRAGYRTLLEPSALVYCGAMPTDEASPFSQGVHAERLFWRNAAAVGWPKALLAHAWLVGWETLTHLVRPSAAARLAGRAWGAIDLSHYLRRGVAQVPANATEHQGHPAPDCIRMPVADRRRIDQGEPSDPGAGGRRSTKRMRSA
jgi:hypothetical protein